MKKKSSLYMDYSMLIVVVLLLCFGLIMVYSASSYEASIKFNDSTYYLRSQLRATVLGIAVMILVSRLDYHIWKKLAVVAYLGAAFLIMLVITPLGMEINGARRWINVGVSLQPAEAAKLAVIVFCAAKICVIQKSLRKLKGIIIWMGPGIVLAGMIYVITKNMSSAIILLGITAIMIFVASPRYLPYVIVTLLVVGGVFGVIYVVSHGLVPESLSTFRIGRIKAWLNPEADASGKGYQTLQALYSIGSGGVLGKGLGQSTQKLGYVPEAQNDMIFSIICEELGLIGALAVIVMFTILIWRFLIVANTAPDLFGSLLVVGVMAHISLQVVLNIAVVTNTIPNTGVTLPFISFGGTSIVFLMTEIGIALNVSRAKPSQVQIY
ncbi:MAG: putative lipid II flippase FtsW [Lachnospiraceae bacterium]|nr:putative lipid II flippase FtsW [Lachnospiraceae bacterium]